MLWDCLKVGVSFHLSGTSPCMMFDLERLMTLTKNSLGKGLSEENGLSYNGIYRCVPLWQSIQNGESWIQWCGRHSIQWWKWSFRELATWTYDSFGDDWYFWVLREYVHSWNAAMEWVWGHMLQVQIEKKIDICRKRCWWILVLEESSWWRHLVVQRESLTTIWKTISWCQVVSHQFWNENHHWIKLLSKLFMTVCLNNIKILNCDALLLRGLHEWCFKLWS